MVGYKFQVRFLLKLWLIKDGILATIDMQHGVIDYPNALNMLQSISTTETTPIARVNWNEPGQIMKILMQDVMELFVQW